MEQTSHDEAHGQRVLEDATRREVLSLILNPVDTKSVAVKPSETPAEYLRKCEQNLLAELWGLYDSKVRPVFPKWRDTLMDKVFFHKQELEEGDGTLVLSAFQDERCSKPVDLREYRWSLVVWRDRLTLLLPPGKAAAGVGGPDTLVFKAGTQVNDRYHTGGNGFFHVVGYVQPYFAELSAIREFKLKLRHGGDVSMLSMLASPSTRGQFTFGTEFSLEREEMRFKEELVPINELQHTIIKDLGRKIECIQGPPGTGKSTTIFHIVQSAVPVGYHAIVTCVQNKALDSIAEKLGPTGMPFVVYGNPSRLGDWAKRFTLAAQVERHPEVVGFGERLTRVNGKRVLVLKSMRAIQSNQFDEEYKIGWRRMWTAWVVRGNHDGYDTLRDDLACLDREFDCLNRELLLAKQVAGQEILESARASLSTMDGMGSLESIGGRRRSVVIIDEAGTVPEYKMPLLLTMQVDAVVTIGDQNQMQPFSHSKEDKDKDMDGFFQRAVKALGDKNVPMLKEQYRMHPAICELVSSLFYAGQLVTAGGVAERRMSVVGGGLSWWDYPDVNAESDGKMKKHNRTEVELVGKFMWEELPELLEQGKSVAVITFYKQQFLELMKIGEDMGIVRTREEMKSAGAGAGRFKDKNFRIVTVDAAQGSEADVVVLSCVRCNRKRELGFITNRNRLCVALSRARERLIVVGSRETLGVDRVWAAVVRATRV